MPLTVTAYVPWAESATAESVSALCNKLTALAAAAPGVIFYGYGHDVANRKSLCTAVYRDAAAYREFTANECASSAARPSTPRGARVDEMSRCFDDYCDFRESFSGPKADLDSLADLPTVRRARMAAELYITDDGGQCVALA